MMVKEKIVWTTRDGKQLTLSEMETSHIENCIRMLKRTIAKRPDEYAYGEPDGEGAQAAFRCEVQNNDEAERRMRTKIRLFQQELSRRSTPTTREEAEE